MHSWLTELQFTAAEFEQAGLLHNRKECSTDDTSPTIVPSTPGPSAIRRVGTPTNTSAGICSHAEGIQRGTERIQESPNTYRTEPAGAPCMHRSCSTSSQA